MDISRVGSDFIKINQNTFQKTSIEPISKDSFAGVLKGYLQNVDTTIKQSSELTNKLATGEINNIHDVTIAAQNAKVALELTVTVRDKAVEAYNEIMRMQL
ncbi:flagellar hook-basal body complex protein FliE [Pseudoneobacillus sp. C159]